MISDWEAMIRPTVSHSMMVLRTLVDKRRFQVEIFNIAYRATLPAFQIQV